MSSGFGLIYVAPIADRVAGLPSRPHALVEQLRAQDDVECVTLVGRVRPRQFARQHAGRRCVMGSRVTGSDRHEVVRHPWPFGRLEAEMIRRLVADHAQRDSMRWVIWISDPKSAIALTRLQAIPVDRLVRVFDAYDAWDLSPLVRGRRRRRAVIAGYEAAARHADIVFANTEFMARRMHDLGAKNISILQNAGPPVRAAEIAQVPDPHRKPYLAYVGRIHERVDVDILAGVAEAFPEIPIRLIGPVEREPTGWQAFVALPNVMLEGPIVGQPLRAAIADAAALLVPHRVDDYTLSQDAMKAWDAIAAGTPVVGTPLPPVIGWPSGLAVIGADRDGFVAGVRSVLNGDLDAHRRARLEFARANGWDARARTAVQAITASFEP